MLNAAEGDNHWMFGVQLNEAFPLHQHRDIARRVRQDRTDLTARDGLAEQGATPLEEQQIDLVLGGEPDEIAPAIGRHESDGPGRDAPAHQRLALEVERAHCPSDLTIFDSQASWYRRRLQKASHDQLSRRLRPRQGFGEIEQRL
jgi:hypothetical protein